MQRGAVIFQGKATPCIPHLALFFMREVLELCGGIGVVKRFWGVKWGQNAENRYVYV